MISSGLRAALTGRFGLSLVLATALVVSAGVGALGADTPTSPLPPGTMDLRVSSVGGTFRLVPGTQDMWELGPFTIDASCPLRMWRVLCELSPMGPAEGAPLPYERMQYVITDASGATRVVPIAPGPVPIIEGGIGTPTGPTTRATLSIRVRTGWEDPAGVYRGTMSFSYYAAP